MDLQRPCWQPEPRTPPTIAVVTAEVNIMAVVSLIAAVIAEVNIMAVASLIAAVIAEVNIMAVASLIAAVIAEVNIMAVVSLIAAVMTTMAAMITVAAAITAVIIVMDMAIGRAMAIGGDRGVTTVGSTLVTIPSYYPYSSIVVEPSAPTTYIEREEGAAVPDSRMESGPASDQSGVWYYCPGQNAYYPYVKECPGGWQTVPAEPPAEPGR